MSIEALYEVVDRNGKSHGLFESKHVANRVEKRVDATFAIFDLLESAMPEATTEQRMAMAELLVTRREKILPTLRSVKDLPEDGEDDEEVDSNTNQGEQAAAPESSADQEQSAA